MIYWESKLHEWIKQSKYKNEKIIVWIKKWNTKIETQVINK